MTTATKDFLVRLGFALVLIAGLGLCGCAPRVTKSCRDGRAIYVTAAWTPASGVGIAVVDHAPECAK